MSTVRLYLTSKINILDDVTLLKPANHKPSTTSKLERKECGLNGDWCHFIFSFFCRLFTEQAEQIVSGVNIPPSPPKNRFLIVDVRCIVFSVFGDVGEDALAVLLTKVESEFPVIMSLTSRGRHLSKTFK